MAEEDNKEDDGAFHFGILMLVVFLITLAAVGGYQLGWREGNKIGTMNERDEWEFDASRPTYLHQVLGSGKFYEIKRYQPKNN